MKIVVVGGVAAGTSAAARARRVNPEAEIILFEKDKNISYAGCGLPYYISGVTPERSQLIMNTPEEFREKYEVEVKISHEVTSIHPENKSIEYEDLVHDRIGQEKYDKLILATGAKPLTPPIPGINLERVLPLRTLQDGDRIKRMTGHQNVKKAVIVGGGYIGLEMAEAFDKLGMDISLIEMREQVMPLINAELADKIESHLQDRGVKLYTGEAVKEFVGDGIVSGVVTDKDRLIQADLVLFAIGVRPVTELAAQAGIELGLRNAIRVNHRMETSLRDVYACGDCAQSINLVSGRPVWVPLGSTANKQGRVAGTNAAGGSGSHFGILATSITKVFDLTIATTGIKEEEAEEAGFDPVSVTVNVPNHAGYYPGFKNFVLRGIFDRNSGRLLGAEALGKSGVNKRIDVLASAIYSELTAEDLFQLDLSYAPPYSTPKDAVSILGMVAGKKI